MLKLFAPLVRGHRRKEFYASLYRELHNQQGLPAEKAVREAENLLAKTSDALDSYTTEELQKGASAVAAYGAARFYACTQEVSFCGPISPDFHDKVLAGWQAIPEWEKIIYKSEKRVLAVGTTGTHVFVDFVGKKVWEKDPKANDQRQQLNHAGGMYYHERKAALVSEYILGSQYDQLAHGSGLIENNLLNGTWKKNPYVQETVTHECAHMRDAVLGEMISPPQAVNFRVCQLPEFQRAYDADVKEQGGYAKARQRGYAYYARAPDKDASDEQNLAVRNRNLEEVYGETGAQALGKSIFGKRMEKDWKNSYDLNKALSKSFDDAFQQDGIVGVFRLISRIKEQQKAFPDLSGLSDDQKNALDPEVRMKCHKIVLYDTRYTAGDVRKLFESIPERLRDREIRRFKEFSETKTAKGEARPNEAAFYACCCEMIEERQNKTAPALSSRASSTRPAQFNA